MLKLLKEAIAEFKKVEWPTKIQTLRLTAYVIGVSLLIGLFVAGIDYLFKELLGKII